MKTNLLSWCGLLILLMIAPGLQAQTAKPNEFTLDARLKTRGELRVGGFSPDSLNRERYSHFFLGLYRITATYKRSWLEVKLSPQYSGVWGQDDPSVSMYEAWAKMQSQQGFFVQLGRQELSYDDGRILGTDDWTMAAPTHDMLRFGYEGKSHKIHLILEYNQTSDNISTGNTFYSSGLQPYKTMQTIWYHYDTPKKTFGVSLVGMNIGMQSVDVQPATTLYQQLVGFYMKYQPRHFSAEGAFYYQMGVEEHNIPLDAFMGSVKLNVQPNDKYSIFAGYDYLSGDSYFPAPAEGNFGLVLHDRIRGFNAIFGSHHKFYGAMDFFYMSDFVNGFTPGLQNLYIGSDINLSEALNINVAYHYYAIATDLDYVNSKTLGNEVELTATYAFSNAVSLSAGYTYMHGSETMVKLNKISNKRQLHWAWLMVIVTPQLFHTVW